MQTLETMVTAIKWVGLVLGVLVAFLAIVGCASIVAALLVRTMQDEDVRVPDDVIQGTRKDEDERLHNRN